jgi:toxin CcdB
MARFDVYRLADDGLVLDCQANAFQEIGTRFVVPLMRESEGPPKTSRLHPSFELNGETLVMITEFAAAIRTSELGRRVGSLDQEHFRIIDAMDTLIGSG